MRFSVGECGANATLLQEPRGVCRIMVLFVVINTKLLFPGDARLSSDEVGRNRKGYKFVTFMAWRSRIILVAKLTITIAILWWITEKVHVGEVVGQLNLLSIPVILAVALLLMVQLALSGQRLARAVALLGGSLGTVQASIATLIGGFFGQTVISFVAGDAMRIWYAVRRGIGLHIAAGSVLLDRAFGLVGGMLMVVGTLPFLLPLVENQTTQIGIAAIAAAALLGTIAFFLLGLMPARWRDLPGLGLVADYASLSRHTIQAPTTGLHLLANSLVVNAINVLVIFILARDLELSLTLAYAFILIPPVIFLSMMPISIAGWGVREGAMVVALALVGIPADKALAVSVLFGLAGLAINLPGGLVWLAMSGKKGKAMNTDQQLAQSEIRH